MKVLNIIVFYDNPIEVENYISEVTAIGNHFVEIAVIVNSDKDDQVKKIEKTINEKKEDCIHIYDYHENVGYLNAMLKTIKKIPVLDYDYVILSNTDIHYDMPDFFQHLEENKYPNNVGCIAPCVFATKSKSFSNPHYMERITEKKLRRLISIFRFPTLGKEYLKFAELKAGKTKTEKKPSCYVYSPHGCYMIFTKSFIDKIRGYEYGVKMYSEESVVGELLMKHQMQCYYDDSISIIHQESSVTGKINYKNRFKLWRESLIYIIDTFYIDDKQKGELY